MNEAIEKLLRLDGLVAVVTGGGSGIGMATASLLAQAGTRVIIVDRDQSKGGSGATELEERPARRGHDWPPIQRPPRAASHRASLAAFDLQWACDGVELILPLVAPLESLYGLSLIPRGNAGSSRAGRSFPKPMSPTGGLLGFP